MYLSRLTLLDHPDLDAILGRLGDAYREHKMLWQLFDSAPDSKRDFLYRRDTYRGRPRYFLLSQRPPVNPLGLWHIDPPKSFQPKLETGQRLAFMLRVNPVVSRKGKRHDIIMDRKTQLRWKKMPPAERPPLPDLIQEAGVEWLRQRAHRHGFSFDDAIRIEGYRQHHTHRGNQKIHFSTLDFTGLLTVTDPAAFLRTLLQGIGTAKAFGCGLMLVRRIP